MIRPIFKLALALEKIALEDEYFISRNLYPNVDFYSGIVQKAIGIPMPLFTAIFAMARTVGWFAQLNEMIDDPAFRIGRPPSTLYRLHGAPRQADRRALNSHNTTPQSSAALSFVQPNQAAFIKASINSFSTCTTPSGFCSAGPSIKNTSSTRSSSVEILAVARLMPCRANTTAMANKRPIRSLQVMRSTQLR